MAQTLTQPRLSYETPANLEICFKVHAAGGPRGLWFAQYGQLDSKPTTAQVEDCAIEFYTAYNAVRPGTF
jgi:hypothetical protein